MFNDFLYHLRQYGLDVSTKEWLTLQEALKMQLHGCSINGLFTLSRAILCKSETEYDKFEVAFLDYFQDVIRYVEASGKDDISAQILDWVNNPARNGARIIRKTAEDITDEMRNWTREDIEKKFRHRLKSQRSEHNGGYHYVGTHGISPFGNSGSNPNAIRVGGKPMSRSALRVAGQQTFQDFREDNVLSIRQFQMAKAAIAVGQKTLLKAAGMEAWQVKKVYLAGGMGTFLNVRAAVETGLVEKSFLPVAKAGGNTSLQGAVSYLKKTGQEQILEKDKLKEITEKMQVLMLADMPDFADAYISHMALTEFKA